MIRTVAGVAFFIVFGVAVSFIANVTRLPLAPAVLGLLLLLALVVLARRIAPRALKHDAPLERGARLLLRWMPLFFIPPAVGIVQSADLLRAAWFQITVVLLASTLASISVTITVLRVWGKRAHA